MEDLQKKLRDKLDEATYKSYDNYPAEYCVILSSLYREALFKYCSQGLYLFDRTGLTKKINTFIGLNGDTSHMIFEDHNDTDNIKIFKLIK